MSLRRFLLIAGCALAGCTGTNAAVLTITGNVTTARHLVIEVETSNKVHTQIFTVPATEGDPLVFPQTVSITFPSTVSGYLQAHVEAFSGSQLLASGDGFNPHEIVKPGVTDVEIELVPVTGGNP